MRKLLALDYKDYEETMPVYEKCSVRAIIMQNGRLAVQKSRDGEYKILGGVVEDGESHLETILREVEEEAGMLVKPDSLRPIGMIEEKRLDVFDKSRIYSCHTYFYFCEVTKERVPLKLTECEIAKGYTPDWELPERIVESNRSRIKDKWKLRDTEFVDMLVKGEVYDKQDL